MVDKKNRKQYAEEQLRLGTACYQKGEIDKALEHVSNILREDDKAEYAQVQFNLGCIYREQSELAKAIDQWIAIQRKDDKKIYAKAQLNVGLAYEAQGELTKAVEHWSNIQREDDNVQYAYAQYNLGLAYRDQGEFTEAVEYWSSIQREDDKKIYAKAQSSVGLTYEEQGELTKAVEHWSSIQREDEKAVYAQVQLNLGLAYEKQGELTKAVEHWSSIQREDDNVQYAYAQYNLGMVYEKQGKFTKAIEYWSNLQREDEKAVYAQVQLNLGLAYEKQGELTKAIEYWGNIQREDEKALYAQAQLNLGLFYYEKTDLIEAIEHFSSVQRKDDKKQYASAQVFLGLAYEKQDDLAKAIKCWRHIQSEDNKKIYAIVQQHLGFIYYIKDELAKAKKYAGTAFSQQESNVLKASILLDKIAILQTYAKGKKSEDYTHFKHELDKIDEDVNEILESLMIKFEEGMPERKVATYTTVRVAKLFIGKAEKSFHLNIANRMNDTTEGQNLFKWMGYAENTETTNTIYGFLTSFTFNHNSLNQFRLYGKTEDKEGTGVSFVVSTDIFSDEHSDSHIKLNTDVGMVGIKSDTKLQDNHDKNKNEDKNKKLITEKIPLYRCIYINPDNGYVSLSQRSRYSFFLEHGDLDDAENSDKQTDYNEYKEKIDESENEVKTRLRNIKASYEKIIALADKKQLRQQTDQLIRKILLPLCFLTKHASFEEEAECRVIYITDIANEKVTFENDRLFVAYGVPVLDRQNNKTYLNKIYLGPKVEDVVKIELQHLYYQQGIKEPIRIEKSNLPLA